MKDSGFKWKLKHLPNVIVRLATFDRCYICEECHKVHKRNGKEIRFDDIPQHCMYNRWWYDGVCRECFEKTMNRVINLLRESLIKSDRKGETNENLD